MQNDYMYEKTGVSFTKKNCIIYVIAHPDDEMISCGASFLNALEDKNNEVHVVLVSDHCDDILLSNYRMSVFSKIMQETNVKCYHCLAQKAYSYSHSELENISEMIKNDLSKKYHLYNKVWVFTHHPDDFNRDHSETAKATILSFRNIECSIFFMDSYAPERIKNFNPTYQYYFGQKRFDEKMSYIDKYMSVTGDNSIIYNKNIILAHDINITSDKVPYSEKFEVYRLI